MSRKIKNFQEIKLDGDLHPQNGRTGRLVMSLVADRSFWGDRFDGVRLDNVSVQNAGLFLLRQLQFVRSEVHQVEYPENKALSFLPLASDIPASVSQYVYYVGDKTGKSRMQTPNAKGPIPRFDVTRSERYGKVVSLVGCYGWTIDELREAARLQMDLPTMKAENAREILLRDTDEVLRTGTLTSPEGDVRDTASDIGGFINHAEVAKAGTALTVTLDDGTTTASNTYGTALHDWFVSTTTPDQMADDLFMLEQAIKTATKAVYVPDSMVMATKLLNKLISTKMSAASDKNVLRYFLDNSRYIKNIDEWIYLDNAGVADSGTGNEGYKHRIITYARDKRVLEAVNPIEYEQQAAQLEGFEFTIPCRAKVGGVKIYRPRAVIYGDVSTKTS